MTEILSDEAVAFVADPDRRLAGVAVADAVADVRTAAARDMID